jgi:hypothetical protein
MATDNLHLSGKKVLPFAILTLTLEYLWHYILKSFYFRPKYTAGNNAEIEEKKLE